MRRLEIIRCAGGIFEQRHPLADSLAEYGKLGPEELTEVRMKALELERSAYEKSKDVYSQTSPME